MIEPDIGNNDLAGIDLSDEIEDDVKKITLFECNNNEVEQSIFGILELPENLEKKEK